jgi:hypothetical protein
MSVLIVHRRVRGPAFCWSTLSWPDLVSDGPRREYLSVSCSTTVFSSAGDSAIILMLPDGASSVVELLTIGWPSAQRIRACCVCLGKNRETRCHQTRNHVSWPISVPSFLPIVSHPLSPHLLVHKPPLLFSSSPHLPHGHPPPFSISVAWVNYRFAPLILVPHLLLNRVNPIYSFVINYLALSSPI